MKRSAGVTVIAVLSLVGSVFMLAAGILAGVAMLVAPPPASNSPLSTMSLRVIFAVAVVCIYVLPSIWGIVTGIGLFRLRNWARISTIVFSALLVAVSSLGLLMAWIVPIPPDHNSALDPSFMSFMRIFITAFWAGLSAVGIWWMVFLTRVAVKAQFVPIAPVPRDAAMGIVGSMPPTASPVSDPASSGRRPISITVIAWFLLIGALFIPLNLVLHTPAVVFTRVWTGWPAGLWYTAFAGLNLYIGVGLLRLRPTARTLGIVYFVFGFVNGSVFYLVPGGRARMSALMNMQRSMFPWMPAWQDQFTTQVDPMPFVIVGTLAGLAALVVPLYFLITRKQAFVDASSTTIIV